MRPSHILLKKESKKWTCMHTGTLSECLAERTRIIDARVTMLGDVVLRETSNAVHTCNKRMHTSATWIIKEIR